MKTMLKPILLVAAVLMTMLVIVFCSALFWINSSHGLQWVQARINTAIPGKITVEKHRLSLLGPGLDLYGAVLHDPRGLSLAGFTHLSVRLDGWALLRRELRVEHILLQAPWAELAVDNATGLNLLNALTTPAPKKETRTNRPHDAGLPFNIVFQSIRLADGRVSFRPSDTITRLETSGITLSADGDLMARLANLDLSLASVRFSSAGIHPEPARVVLKARLDGDTLNLPVFDITSGRTALKISGSADQLDTTPLIDGVVSIDSQLSELKTIFDLAGDHSGALNAELTVKGTVANPDARLELTLAGGRIAGRPVDRGDLSIHLQDRQVAIDTAALRLKDGNVILNGTINLREAFPTGFLAPQTDVNAVAYTLTLIKDIPDLNPWLKPFIEISGSMTGQASITGTGITPSGISARLAVEESGRNLLAPGLDRPVDADVTLSARMDRGKVSLSQFKADANGIELSGNGIFQMDKLAVAGKLALTAEDLSRALAVVGIPSVNGACEAILTVAGSLNRPQFSVDFASRNLTVDTYTIGDLTIDADMNHDGQVNLTALTLHNQGSRIRGAGRFRLMPNNGGIDPEFVNDLDLALEKLSAADFMQSPPINGTLDGRLQVGGPLGSLKGGLSLNARALRTDVATIGDVEASMRLNAGTVFMDRLHLRNQDSRLTAAGSIDLLIPGTLRLVEDPRFDVSTDSDHLAPENFIDTIHGDFALKGVLTGSVENPTGRLTLAGTKARLAGQPVETLLLDARLEERRLWLDRLVAAIGPGEQMEGGGWVGLDRTVDLNVKSEGIAVSSIQGLNDFFPGEGVLRFNVNGKGRMDNPDIEGHLSVSDVIVNHEAIEDVNLTVSLHDMLARVTGNLNFEIDATCDLKKGDFDTRLVFDRTETGSYFKAAGKPDFHGTLTGRLEAAGNIREVAAASADLHLNHLQFFYKDKSLVRSDRIVAQLADQTLSIPGIELALLSTGSLAMKGNARLGGPFDIDISGHIPLPAVKLFSDGLVDATGVIVLDGRLTGDANAPGIDAWVDLQDIALAVPGLAQKLHDLNGRLHLTGDSITIDALEGFLDTGSFKMAGTIGHRNFEPTRMDLEISAGALPLEIPDTLAVLLNGDIHLTGKDGTADARGEILLLEGIYYEDVKINLLKMATTRQRTVAPAARPVSVPFFEKLNLGITVAHRQPFMVQNNLAQLEISPDLKIGGSLNRPIVNGRAQVKTGTITFQKRTFDVKKGVIDFVNPYRTEAAIDIESQMQIRSWLINLSIKGTPDNLDLNLSSVPAESNSDILSLILFGRTARELTAGEGAAGRTTTQIMAEMIAETLGEDIKKTTGVDILQLESNGDSDAEDSGDVKVTVGKHLSDRTTIKYAVETKDGEIIQRAITEYKLLEHILVSGFQDTRGVYGSELVFRIEFR